MLKLQYKKGLEGGLDEAGRGCLAGPVTAACVILPKNFSSKRLNDSKKISKITRDKLRVKIEKEAISFSVFHIFSDEIDKINILNATIKAMHISISKLKIKPERLIIDGNYFKPYNNIPYNCIIKGDEKFQNIAAASILAKTYRDELMSSLDKAFPKYFWNENKGYATIKHRESIKQNGITIHHRKTFKLLTTQTKLNLFIPLITFN
jgi:ribonuclease HII